MDFFLEFVFWILWYSRLHFIYTKHQRSIRAKRIQNITSVRYKTPSSRLCSSTTQTRYFGVIFIFEKIEIFVFVCSSWMKLYSALGIKGAFGEYNHHLHNLQKFFWETYKFVGCLLNFNNGSYVLLLMEVRPPWKIHQCRHPTWWLIFIFKKCCIFKNKKIIIL